MTKKLLGVVLAAATLAAPAVFACEEHAKASVKKVSIDQVATLQKEKKVTVLDVNGADFRKTNGVIPGAVLLTHFNKYDVAKELPATKDSKLVFYCSSLKCPASHTAAEKALEAGYTDVNVLPDGLLGWKQAGQPTASVAPQS